ncbi:MAG: nicotinate (nicotinamide) nucleotide adenylyltransferase [Acidobacteria bacterium 13_1_20CM_3_53_8]|nr:MAG: nicotinate (nicotinamide) nucleotide adenylyltransferase [Acidobacteria bacterium 13_1_20CM_3_53_8]
MKRRIALYGGTFDPVHLGHLSVAEKLLELFALDEVLFIPATLAPHKRSRDVTSAWHRYAMLALATEHDERLRVSSVELDAPEKPYTVETLSRLQSEMKESARLFLVMGADSWREIQTWREWRRVLEMSDHIVVTRPGYELDAAHVGEEFQSRVIDLRGASSERILNEVEKSAGEKIFVTDAVVKDVSSTQVRQLARRGRARELAKLVPPSVADYIEKYRLYREA